MPTYQLIGPPRCPRGRARFIVRGSIYSGTQLRPKSGVVALDSITLMPWRTRCTHPAGDLSLAYQVFGDGPIELVVAGSFASHVELCWTLPEFEAFFEQLSTYCRVLLFDKAGVGLSDPVPKVRTLDDRAAEIETVMDAVGFGKAVIFGLSEGGPAAIVFAARRPERTRALILTGSFAYFGFAGWDDMDRDPAELRARLLAGWVRTTPRQRSSSPASKNSAGPSARRGAAVRHSASAGRRPGRRCASWECRSGCAPARGWRGRHLKRRSGSTCGRSCRRSPCPPWSSMPATTPSVPAVQSGRYLADHIPSARSMEVDGADHAPWFTDPDGVTSGIEEFLTGSHGAPSQSHRALRTVLFTDMCRVHGARRGSGRRAVACGAAPLW